MKIFEHFVFFQASLHAYFVSPLNLLMVVAWVFCAPFKLLMVVALVLCTLFKLFNDGSLGVLCPL